MQIRILLSLSIISVAAGSLAVAGPIEIYQMPGDLLTASHGMAAVRLVSEGQYSEITGSAVVVHNLLSRAEIVRITSQQALDLLPHLASDRDVALGLHYQFGASVAIAEQHIVIGSPGSQWECDCTEDPGIEVRGRPGRVFVFSLDDGKHAATINAPSLDILRQENLQGADWDWVNFGANLGANDSTAIIQGRGYHVATGEQQFRLPRGADPFTSFGNYFGSVVADASTAITAFPWVLNGAQGAIFVYDIATRERLHTIGASDGRSSNFFGKSIALDGNLALVGAPNDPIWGREPGTAHLINVETGEEIRKFAAGSAGQVDLNGVDGFGYSVALQGNLALIGAPFDSELNHRNGAAYVFDTSSGQLIAKILPDAPEHAGEFGSAVALTNQFALVQGPRSTIHVFAIPEPGSMHIIAVAISAVICGGMRKFRHQ
jgi:hypothetical protein